MIALLSFGTGYLTRMATAPAPAPVAPTTFADPKPELEEVAPEAQADGDLVPGRLYAVARVVDGDTIDLETGDRVRFLGVNTPETGGKKGVEWYGPQAKAFTRKLLEGRSVRLSGDGAQLEKGHYGRWLAYIERDDGLDVTAELVRTGHALSYRKYPCGRKEEFNQLEFHARANFVGMWWNPDGDAFDRAPILVTKSSGMVHAAGCGSGPSRENAIPFRSLQEAKAAGYTQLHRCLEE